MPRLVVDEIVTMYDMDPKGYVKGVKAVSAANKELLDSKKKAGLSGGNNVVKLAGMTAADFDPVQSALRGLSKLGIAAAAAVGAAGYAAKRAFENFAEFEAMELALAAVEGGAKEAEKAIKKLREAAKAPGLEFGEAVSGYLQIRRSGADQGFAEALVKQIGNANALGGGGKESFSRALLAVSQMLMKPFLQGEELLQLMEAGIPAAKIVKDRFGTADTEMLKKQGIGSEQVLQGILQELEKLPRVAGGAKNTLENFNSAIHFMSVSIGSAIAQVATKPLEALSASVDKFTDAGVWQDAITSFAESLGLISDEATGADDILLDIAAGFMTLGDHLEIFKGNIEGLYQSVKNWVRYWMEGPLGFASEGFWNMFGMSPKKWSQSDSTLSQDLFPSFEDNRNELEMKLKLDEKKKEREQKKGDSAAPGKKDPLTSPPQLASAIPVLRQIAENTDPLRAISAQILGGGALAKNAINRQDLSELGGRSGDWRQEMVRVMEMAVRGEIAARTAGRREV